MKKISDGISPGWLLLFPVIAWAVCRFGLGFNGLYGQDAHLYFQFARDILSSDADLSVYGVPPLYPLLGAGLGWMTGHTDMFLQLISLGAFCGIMIYARLLIFTLWPNQDKKWVPGFLAVFLLLSPYMFRGGMVVMTDMLATFLSTGTVLFYLYYRTSENARPKWLILAVTHATLAFITRYAVAPFLLLVCLDLVWTLWLRKKYLHLLTAALVAGICFIPYIAIKASVSGEITSHHLMETWSPLNLFRSSFEGPDGVSNYPVINLFSVFYHTFHPAYLFLGILLWVFVRKKDINRTTIILFLTVVIYSLFVGGMNFQNKRYLMISFPVMLVLLYPAFLRLLELINSKLKSWILIGIGSVQILLCLYVFSSFYILNQFEQHLAENLQNRPSGKLYTFVVNQALETYEVPQQVLNLYDRVYEDMPVGSLLLINEQQWENQWKDKNPMLNVAFARDNFQLVPQQSFPGGWELYRLQEK